MPPTVNPVDLILDPAKRGVEPRSGQIGYVRMFGEPSSIDHDKRTMRFTCSTKNLDRYSEIVDPQAFKKWLPTFMANPVMMAGHVYIAPDGKPTTIGRWLELEITDDGLTGVAQFMGKDSSGLAESYWERYSQGFQRAVSVGWITHQWQMEQLELDGVSQRVRVFKEVELVEISAVAIPANRESLVRAASAFAAPPAGDAQEIDQRQIEQLSKALEPAVETSMKKMLNAGPCSLMGTFVTDVVDIVLGQAGLRVERDYDIPDDDDAPDPSPESPGSDELKTMLRDTLDRDAGDEG